MKKHTILYILLFFLIVVNGFFIYNSLEGTGKTEQFRPKKPRAFISEELDFSEAQSKAFKANSKGHHETIMRLQDDINELKNQLFEGVSNDDFSEQQANLIIDLLNKKQREKDQETYRHFKMISDLCTPDQKKKLSKIIQHALRGGANNRPPPRGGNPPRHDRRPPMGERPPMN